MPEYIESATGKRVNASEKAYREIYAPAGFVTPEDYQKHMDGKASAEASAKAKAKAAAAVSAGSGGAAAEAGDDTQAPAAV